MLGITDVQFPVIAYTIHGVMPYLSADAICRVMPKEYKQGFYSGLEVLDSTGTGYVIEQVDVLKRPKFGGIFGGMIIVDVVNLKSIGEQSVGAIQSRVDEWLELYSYIYEASGGIEDLRCRAHSAASAKEMINVFKAYFGVG